MALETSTAGALALVMIACADDERLLASLPVETARMVRKTAEHLSGSLDASQARGLIVRQLLDPLAALAVHTLDRSWIDGLLGLESTALRDCLPLGVETASRDEEHAPVAWLRRWVARHLRVNDIGPGSSPITRHLLRFDAPRRRREVQRVGEQLFGELAEETVRRGQEGEGTSSQRRALFMALHRPLARVERLPDTALAQGCVVLGLAHAIDRDPDRRRSALSLPRSYGELLESVANTAGQQMAPLDALCRRLRTDVKRLWEEQNA